MYEMYPQQWGAHADQATQAPKGGTKPRRRARREHLIAPRVIRVTSTQQR